MMSNYKLNIRLLDSINNRFSSEMNSFTTSKSKTFSDSYLSQCSNNVINNMNTKINEKYSKIESGYNSINNWLGNYVNDVKNLESGLSNKDYNINDQSTKSFFDSNLRYGSINMYGASNNITSNMKKLPLIIDLNNPEEKKIENLPLIVDLNNPDANKGNYVQYASYQTITPEVVDDEYSIDTEVNYEKKPKYDDRGFELNEIDSGESEYYKKLKEIKESIIAIDNNRPIFEEIRNDIIKDRDELKKYRDQNWFYNIETKEWETSHVKEIVGVEGVNSEYIESVLAEYDEYVENFVPIYPMTKPLDKITWINKKLEELDGSIEYMYQCMDSMSNAAAAYKKYYPILDYMDIYESKAFTDFGNEYNSQLTYDGDPESANFDWLADYEKNGGKAEGTVSVMGTEFQKVHTIKLKDGDYTTEISMADLSKYATEDEKMMYHYLLQEKGVEAANDYLLRLVDNVNLAKGYEMAEAYLIDMKTIENYEENADSWWEAAWSGWMGTIHSFFGGVEIRAGQTIEGIGNLFSEDNHMSAKQYRDALISQYMIQGNYGDYYKVGSAFGSVLPMIAVAAVSRAALVGLGGTAIAGAAASKIGLAYMFLSTAGNAKVEAMTQYGASPESALLYGCLIGASETTLQYFVGKLPLLSAEWGLSFKNVMMDGLDEWLQVYVQNDLTAIMYGETIDVDKMDDEALEAFLMGMIVSGVLNMGDTVVKLKIEGKDIEIKCDKLVELMKEFLNDNSGSINIGAFKKFFSRKKSYSIEELSNMYDSNPEQIQKILTSAGVLEGFVELLFKNYSKEDIINYTKTITDILNNRYKVQNKTKDPGIDYFNEGFFVSNETGSQIQELCSDDNYVYLVHTCEGDKCDANVLSSIEENGVKLTGHKSQAAGDMGSIDLADNTNFITGSTGAQRTYNTLRAIFSSCVNRATHHESPDGYAIIIKIPKDQFIEVKTDNSMSLDQSNLAEDSNVIVEKDGTYYINPEYIEGVAYVFGDAIIPDKTNIKSDTNINTQNYILPEYLKTDISTDQLFKGINDLSTKHPNYARELNNIKLKLLNGELNIDQAVKLYTKYYESILKNEWVQVYYMDFPKYNFKQKIIELNNYSHLELQEDGTYNFYDYNSGGYNLEGLVRYALSNNIDLESDVSKLNDLLDKEINYKSEQMGEVKINKYNGSHQYMADHATTIGESYTELLNSKYLTSEEKAELYKYSTELESYVNDINKINNQSEITKSDYVKMSREYDYLRALEDKLSQYNGLAWERYYNNTNAFFGHTFSRDIVSASELEGPKICTSFIGDTNATFAYGDVGIEYKPDMAYVDSLSTSDAGSWDLSSVDPIKRIVGGQEIQVNDTGIWYDTATHSKLIPPEVMENSSPKDSNYTEIVLKNYKSLKPYKYFYTEKATASDINLIKEIARRDGVPLEMINTVTLERTEIPLY